MKNIFVSASAVALAASVVQVGAQGGSGMVDDSKIWSVGATLRGFYDDNYTTTSKSFERDSFGAEISPTIALAKTLDQTKFGLRYVYGAKWYEDRANQNSDNNPWDQSHRFDANINHAFNERYLLDATDTLVISQEPELLTGPSASPYPYRTDANSLINNGQLNFSAMLTRQLSLVIGYKNTYYDYQDDDGTTTSPSLAGQLNRMEQIALLNLRWQTRPDTTLVLGYNYGDVGYTSDEILYTDSNGVDQSSDVRNNHSHYIYGGVDQNFSKDLTLSVRGGAQMVDPYNDPASSSTIHPYGTLSLSYAYLPGSSIQGGFTYSSSQTDVLYYDSVNGVTAYQETAVLFASVHHQFDVKWSATVTGHLQNSTFNGGTYDSEKEGVLGAGATLAYRFNQHFSAALDYNYTQLSSDVPNRDYNRSIIGLGLIATY